MVNRIAKFLNLIKNPSVAAFLVLAVAPGTPAARESGGPIPKRQERLLEVADSLSTVFYQMKSHALEKSGALGLQAQFTTKEGVRYELMRIEDGLPFYYRTLNLGGAVTSGAIKLHPGGTLRLMLTGRGMTVGAWDSGSVYESHIEFEGRAQNMNPTAGLDAHATHVAGTLIARGYNQNAKGMVFEGRLRAYDWNNDLAEMNTEAANGLLISNHSYGTPLGWEYQNGEWRWMGAASAQEDYRFGFYSNISRALDQITYTAPHYLIVWAAGNDRNDTGPPNDPRPGDGPYDTVGPEGVTKNVLTIGAVNGIQGGYSQPSDVVITDFSSWGPTDDGRIKPDLVTKGRLVFSTNLNDQYRSSSGTSMAAPIASGSLMLIQQLYHELTEGSFLKASSLKGLAIHTASETGNNPGPDYSFGWGLLNVGKMAEFLTGLENDHLHFEEGALENDQEYVYGFTSNGNGPIIATLAWSDVPGTPVAPSLNPPDLMLVNDLDMRVVHEDGTIYYPWILDPENPSRNATTGDNFRDNVEKILVREPRPGNYQLIITHKGSLVNNRQEFSLFVQSGEVPSIKDLYWVGGNGRWNDPSKWSFKSGGPAAKTIPGPNYNAVLDENSFGNGGQVLEITEDSECFTLVVLEGTKGNLDLGNNKLHVNGSVYAESDVFMANSSGKLLFQGRQRNLFVLINRMNKSDKATLDLVFDNGNGKWNIVSDLEVRSILLKQGDLVLNNIQLNVENFVVKDNALTKSLAMEGAMIQGLNLAEFTGSGLSILTNKAGLVFGKERQPPVEARLVTDGHPFYSLVNYSNLEVEGLLLVNTLDNKGVMNINSDLDAEDIRFSPGSGFNVGRNARILVGNSLSGSGAPGSLVPFTGHPAGAGIVGKRNRIFCLDFVSVVDLPASGPAVFNAGPNSVIENSDGWISTECGEVLFADFSVISPCRYSWTFFLDESTGDVQEWEWEFGNLGTSSKQNPVFTFEDTGIQVISLTIRTKENEHTTEKELQIIENPLPNPQVFLSGNIYFVDAAARSYQWYRNGDPIEGATAQAYTNAENLPGIYQVLISNEICNRPSRNQIVVNVKEALTPESSLRVYPNPARYSVRIETEREMRIVELFDLAGRSLIRYSAYSTQSELDVAWLQPGIYVLRVHTPGQVLQTKIHVY